MRERSLMKLVYCFDIDGTICSNAHGLYELAVPYAARIAIVNALYAAGHTVKLFTARGSVTGLDWRIVTKRQLTTWGVRYHELIFGKPEADVFIGDKSMEADAWFANNGGQP